MVWVAILGPGGNRSFELTWRIIKKTHLGPLSAIENSSKLFNGELCRIVALWSNY